MDYIVSVGLFPDGTVAEIFLNTEGRAGSSGDINVSDAAVAISLALQHGCPLAVLREAMKRNSDGSPMGPLAQALDLCDVKYLNGGGHDGSREDVGRVVEESNGVPGERGPTRDGGSA